MYWMIGGDGREYGPVTAEQLREWLAEHRANGQTQIRHDGESDWRPLSEFPEFADALQAATAVHAASAPPPITPVLTAATEPVPARPLDIGGCLGRAWVLLTRHFFLLSAACAMVWGLLTLLQWVVCVGPIISLLLTGSLMVGLNFLALKVLRGQPARLNDLFAFFGPVFIQFMLLGIVREVGIGIGHLFCWLPGLVLQVLWMFAYVMAAERPGHFWETLETSRRAVLPRFFPLAGLMALAWLPTILVSLYVGALSGSYAMDLFMSGGGFTPDAEKLQQLAEYTVNLEVKRMLVVLLNMPFALAVTVQAYEDLFGRRPHTG
jgi:hypothetical protein